MLLEDKEIKHAASWAKIKSADLTPEERERGNAVFARCLDTYIPENGEREFCGWFAFDAVENAAECCMGWTVRLSGNRAVIGLEKTLLLPKAAEFAVAVVLHELGHLSHWGHGKDFCHRWQDIQFCYYMNQIMEDDVA